ncbi:uncharacterized protein LOC102629349 isoform X3 [Citrus sinensis]|uniref:uncharacterized protein LOC102629349 isoform X3 n=1 Tax=Citrus sinensis TaxID=2711 RepID=UPI002278492C|nr:uncharacterized protein LOC102629349 isoform X3 [Citrus sinensis]
MIAQSLTVNPFPNSFLKCHRPNPGFLSPSVSLNVSRWNEAMSMRLSRERTVGTTVLASKEQSSSYNSEKKRKVVEHICLLKAKKDLSEEEENDMLDYLYTSQYQMGGIVAISLENYTHGVFMRFQRKEQLVKFYENPFYSKVLKEHVMPYCHGLMNVDYETEVEDDILPIFRKGEDFNFGVEFVLLISFIQSAFGGPAEDALESLKRLTAEFPSLIVQSTQGSNFNLSSEIYTHAVVIRLRSVEAFEMFVGSSDYKEVRCMWSNKFQPIIRTQLPVHFSVDPVGTEIM